MYFTFATTIVALAGLAATAPRPEVQNFGTVTVPITKRSGLINAGKSVSIEAIKSHVALTKAKILRGLNNFQKNTGVPHPSASKRTKRREIVTDPLMDDRSELWFGTISVGIPLHAFTVDFDTGSSDLVLPGPECTSNCAGHAIYVPSRSSTSQDLSQNFSLAYGDGSTVSGELFSDTVSVSGLTAVYQTLGVAATYSSSLSVNSFPPDGLMGMAFQSISSYNATPVFESIVSQGQADEPVFSFKLAASGSELYLGGVNSALYTGDFTYVPVTHEGYWQVNVDGIGNDGQTILNNADAIIDTGTTFVIGDPSRVATLYDVLGGTEASSTVGQGYYTFPCDAFPAVSFTFGGTSFPISAETLNIGQVPGLNACISGIVGQDTGSEFWILGDVFLQNVYTTFDIGNSRVGFAQLA